jgi:hypothetical protein
MISLQKCLRLLDDGFSLITVGQDKQPNYSWKNCQTKALDKVVFEKQYNYKGGYIKKDGTEMPATENVGLVTGFDYLECIDIDLKVFSTSKEQHDFWNEFYSFVKDNIYDFEDKFVVAKTKNAGYHILYKSKRVQGNTKIAKLKGHKEAIIESRGIGGYVFLYENFLMKRQYNDIQFISDNDREILWTICQSYNFVEQEVEIPIKKEKKYQGDGLKVWEDFDNRTSIFDIISDEFTIVRRLNDKTVIKRKDSKNVSSGSVFNSNGCMYLFTTGSSYPHEKLISPFVAYTYKMHNGDFSASAKELYAKGYGDRIVNFTPEIDVEIPKIENNNFPIDIFPETYQKYILANRQSLNLYIDFMCATLLFLVSIIIGNSVIVRIKNGWTESASVWFSLVGKAGVGKTPSINAMRFPLQKLNSIEIQKYVENYKKYEVFMNLSEQDKKTHEIIHKPKKTQFLVNDVTLEALVELHDENKNGIGILKDELAGWLKDMNKYREGSDLEHWLSSWSNGEINMNRKTAKSSFVERAFMPVLGGIQPEILESFYTAENKDNGFLDRMLFVYPDFNIEYFSNENMNPAFLDWYENEIVTFYKKVREFMKVDLKGNIEPYIAEFTSEAKNEWIKYHNEITDLQKSDSENEYLKSMLPKQKSYISRFALILNALHSHTDSNVQMDVIEKKSVDGAIKLSRYFIDMARKIKVSSSETNKIKKLIKNNEGNSDYETFKNVYSKNEKISKIKLAELLNVSRTTIYRFIEEFNKQKK